MIMTGRFKKRLPFRELNPKNLTADCKCRIVDVVDNLYFQMEPRCMEHVLVFLRWKITGKDIPLNDLKLTYTWNEISDGTNEAIK